MKNKPSGIKTYGIKDAAAAGVSRLVRSAEEDGFVIIQRDGSDVALVMPLTLRGLEKMRSLILQAMTGDTAKLKGDPELAAVARSITVLFQKDMESLPEGLGSAEEQPGSAGQGGITGRRRKKLPASQSQ